MQPYSKPYPCPPPPSISQIVPSPPGSPSPNAGEQLRDQQIARVDAARKTCVLKVCRTMLLILLRQDQATADDLRAEFVIPVGVNPNIVGAAFQKLKRAGLIQAVGIGTSRRAARHAGINRIWSLTDHVGAEHWLANNPETETGGGAA